MSLRIEPEDLNNVHFTTNIKSAILNLKSEGHEFDPPHRGNYKNQIFSFFPNEYTV